MPDFKSIFRVVDSDAVQVAPGDDQGEVMERIRGVVDSNDVMIFMKGTPEFPQCGFSAATIEAFNAIGVSYATRDVLEDPELRQGIKDFSNWPTIPQVYVGGKFIGGSDIVTDLFDRGELGGVIEENLPK